MVELLMNPRVRHPQRVRGFTLIEVLVSLTIVSVGVLALGNLLVRSIRTAEAASKVSLQTAVMATEAARLDAVPFGLLAAGTTCQTVTALPFPHTLCTTITNISAKLRHVKIVVTPNGQPPMPADSVMFERSISGNGTPLNTP
jgi:prepilin-type N-terminal cleavage/methylation domain-containing protein